MNARIKYTIIGIVVFAILGIILLNNLDIKKPPARITDIAQNSEPAIRDSVQVEKDQAFTIADSTVVQDNRNLPRLLELGSVGCRPCDMMAPILDELTAEYDGKLSVEFYDVRKDPSPAYEYKIRLIPTQIFLDSEGNEFFRHEGFFSKEEIVTTLARMGVSK